MQEENTISETQSEAQTDQTPAPTYSHSSSLDSASKIRSAVQSLSHILSSLPSSDDPSIALLHDPQVTSDISSLLRQTHSGAGDNNLCRWLYDTFQSSDPDLQLVVLRFVPVIAGVYLSRIGLKARRAGFEAVLLALYAYETTSRAGQAMTVNIPILSQSSIYHESKAPPRKDAAEPHVAVLSPSLEPYGTVRSSRRARIVGVALELYYSKISQMPEWSKMDFCQFCRVWAGQNGDMYKEGWVDQGKDASSGTVLESGGKEKGGGEGRIPLPWELLQPALRILSNCLLGPIKNDELREAASAACRSLYARSLHDIDPKAILATESLLSLGKMNMESDSDFDPSDMPKFPPITP